MTSQVQEIGIKKNLTRVNLEYAPLFNEQQIKVAVLSSLMIGQIWQFSLRIIKIRKILELHLEQLW